MICRLTNLWSVRILEVSYDIFLGVLGVCVVVQCSVILCRHARGNGKSRQKGEGEGEGEGGKEVERLRERERERERGRERERERCDRLGWMFTTWEALSRLIINVR